MRRTRSWLATERLRWCSRGCSRSTRLCCFGENQRYDLVVEHRDRFHRIKCKTGRLRNGVVRFNACSTTYHYPKGPDGKPYKHDYRGEADFFGVYCPENDKCYLVPVGEIGKSVGSLLLDRTINNQSLGIRWADPYEIGSTAIPKRSVDAAEPPCRFTTSKQVQRLFEVLPRYPG